MFVAWLAAYRVRLIAVFAALACLIGGVAALTSRAAEYEFGGAEVRDASDEELARFMSLLNGASEDDGPQYARLRGIFDAVLSATGRLRHAAAVPVQLQLRLLVLRHPWPIASSTASGKVVVSTGFLDNYELNDDEVAFVFAHEIAHAMCEHQRVQLSAVWKRNAPQKLQPRDVIQFMETEPLVRRQIAPLVLVHERIADVVGLELTRISGFDAERALGFFDKAELRTRAGVEEPVHDSPRLRAQVLRPIASLLKDANVIPNLLGCSL
jgi:hypothetical protein